jgi:hypothetical protein
MLGRSIVLLGSFEKDGDSLHRLLRKHSIFRTITYLTTSPETLPPAHAPHHFTSGLAHLSTLLPPTTTPTTTPGNAEKASNSPAPCVISYGSRMDTDSSFAFFPSGELHLNVDEVAYRTLGLEGAGVAGRRNISFSRMQMSKIKIRERVDWALGARTNRTAFLAARFDERTGESMAFQPPVGCEYRVHETVVETGRVEGLEELAATALEVVVAGQADSGGPEDSEDGVGREEERERISDFLDRLGLALLPPPSAAPPANMVRETGLLHYRRVTEWLKHARAASQEHPAAVSVIVACGFDDLPHVWGVDRNFERDGANDIVLLITKERFAALALLGDQSEPFSF